MFTPPTTTIHGYASLVSSQCLADGLIVRRAADVGRRAHTGPTVPPGSFVEFESAIVIGESKIVLLQLDSQNARMTAGLYTPGFRPFSCCVRPAPFCQRRAVAPSDDGFFGRYIGSMVV